MREPGAGTVDLVLRLMDHQMVGPSGGLLGNVDNLVLRHDADALEVVGVLTGPGGFGPRQPGLLGEWIVAVWRRFSNREDPRPLMIPMVQVRSIGSAISLTEGAEEILNASQGLEQWLRRHVISAIPGAKEGDDRSEGTVVVSPSPPGTVALADTHLLSDLLGAEVFAQGDAFLGTVMEVRARPVAQAGGQVGDLTVTSIVFGRRRLGGELGYTTLKDQGPWLLARALGWWHRQDHEARWEEVDDVDWGNRRLTLGSQQDWPHPHAADTGT